MRPTPAVSARATSASRSSAKSGKSRWQWLSTSMACKRFNPPLVQRSAETRRPAAAGVAPALTLRVLSAAKSRCVSGTPRLSSSLRRGLRHHRLGQDRDLPHDLGGHVEHGVLPRRIGLGQRPRRFAREIAVGFRDHGPHRVRAIGGSAASPCARARRRAWRRPAPDRLVVVGEFAGFRQHAAKVLAIIDSERCARLPRSLARSALMRATMASWL